MFWFRCAVSKSFFRPLRFLSCEVAVILEYVDRYLEEVGLVGDVAEDANLAKVPSVHWSPCDQ